MPSSRFRMGILNEREASLALGVFISLYVQVTKWVTMSEAVPTFAQEAYAILRNRFASDSFPADYLSWFVSGSMVKKTLHTLERAGWIRRVEKGSYVCRNADDIFRSMIDFKVPRLLSEAGMRYAYTDASAVEVWTDYSYIQRSWEHSPYFVRVLRSDLGRWISYFRKHKVKVFTPKPELSMGEFVILKPDTGFANETRNGLPVDPLELAVTYAEKHIHTFEYPLAYLKTKFKVKPRVEIDRRVLTEAAKAVV